MGLFDVLLGRSKPVKPDLDQLFGLPDAALTLAAATDFRPTGHGAVCYSAAEGGAFTEVTGDVKQLLDATSAEVEQSRDSYGYTWLTCHREPNAMPDLVGDLHAVNSSLEGAGFGPQLLCTLVSFVDTEARSLALVYLFKRGSFYPFAPLPGEKRDNALELQVRGMLGNDLRLEADLGRWFPVWGAPGLS